MLRRFTAEENAWLRENYPKDESREETYRRYCKTFGDARSISSVVSYCKKRGINKPNRQWKKGNVPWSKGLSKEEHRSHFTGQSFAAMVNASRNNFPHVRDREEMNAPKGYVVTDLGDGEKMLIRRDIWICMREQGTLHAGELTKAAYEIYLVKKRIEKQTGKLLRNPTDNTKPERLAELRAISSEKRKVRVVAKKDGMELRFDSMAEAGKALGITDSLISRAVNGQYKKTHGWTFRKEE